MIRSAVQRGLVVVMVVISLQGGAARGNPEIPGEAQQRPVAIVGATVHTVADGVAENATLLIRNGKIAAIGTELKVPKRAVRIDAAGKHVYPGLFAAHSDIGLVEINAVRATLGAA